MTLPWFRLYSRIIDDDKLRLLAFEDRWHFVALCCLKSDGLLDEADSDLRTRRVAVKLGVQVREIEEIARRLREVGLIDERLNPLAWEELQQRSDNSTSRVQKYREKRRAAGLKQLGDYSGFKPALIARDGELCVYCSSTENLVVDHMVPISLGGTDDPDNLALACKGCNSGKAGRTPEGAKLLVSIPSARDALARYRDKNKCNGDGHGIDGDEEVDEEVEPNGSCASGDALTIDNVFDHWNADIAPLGKRAVVKRTPERRQLVKARIGQNGLDEFLAVFANIRASPFLLEAKGLQFDWFMQKKNFTKVLEGNYNG